MDKVLKATVAGIVLAFALPVYAVVEFSIPATVKSWEAPELATNGVKAVWIENVPWHGKDTRFFAYPILYPPL